MSLFLSLSTSLSLCLHIVPHLASSVYIPFPVSVCLSVCPDLCLGRIDYTPNQAGLELYFARVSRFNCRPPVPLEPPDWLVARLTLPTTAKPPPVSANRKRRRPKGLTSRV
ncbi:unnamed protein product [Protopolystoma xenopodis]|uniref:Secreted protein n=1 Tax=Protopolystoma xenopodis TaxID=117903 RepID=A0A448WA11_9PLAT|nr:unnamed protein product [Protopolystoma xenopodis]